MKCPNCTAESDGKYCPYCGTLLKDDDTAGIDSLFGFGLNEYNKCVSDAFKAVQDCQRAGKLTPEYFATLQNSFDMMNASRQMMAGGNDEQREKNKKARKAIAKRICPACGKRFEKGAFRCGSCNASLLPEDYFN